MIKLKLLVITYINPRSPMYTSDMRRGVTLYSLEMDIKGGKFGNKSTSKALRKLQDNGIILSDHPLYY